MKTVVLSEPGRFDLLETNSPPPPAPGEAQVRVHRIGVCGTDLHAFAGRQPFFDYPRILGHELGVEVLALNETDAPIKVGDHCTIQPYLNNPDSHASLLGKSNCCEELRVLGIHTDGGMRPLINVPASKLLPSRSLSLDQLALVEMLCIGAHATSRAQPTERETALIIGAGPIGLSVLQFVKLACPGVIVMDISEERLAFAREAFGIDRTLVANADDPGARLRELAGGNLPNLIFDCTGNARSMMSTFDRVAHGGRIVFVGLFQGEVTFNDPNFHRRELTLMSSRNATPDDFSRVISSLEEGSVNTDPWITHRLTLDEVPARFPHLPEAKGLVKAIIEVPA